MKIWLWVSCWRCGFLGCAAPFDDARCPKCLGPIETPSVPRAREKER